MISLEKIPKEVQHVAKTLENKGFEAYLVGGCVRDLLLGKTPDDWDITTNATPEEIMTLFPHTFYENNFGTVGVVIDGGSDPHAKAIEVTTYRLETTYSDGRHPDTVTFSKNLEDDLKRRDFTINAFAYQISKGQLIDLYNGQKDLTDNVIRAVGDPTARFREDGLRILRAIRIATVLDFTIDPSTEKAAVEESGILKKIAKERIRDEFSKMLMAENPMKGIILSHKFGVLQYISTHFEKGIGVEQNQAHKFDVFEHNLKTLQHAAKNGWSLELRLASLFHDIAKPETRRWSNEKKDWTFYGHDVVGARVTRETLKSLKYPSEVVQTVSNLVRWHMFFSDPEKITLSAIRRLIRNIGKENIWDLMNLRVCDRIGTGRPKENPYRFRKYKSMVEEVLHDPITVGMLKIDGSKLMEVTHETPGPRLGFILHALLEEVLEDPKLNTEEFLMKRSLELSKLNDQELKKLGEKGKERKESEEESKIKEIRDKYWVE